VVGGDARAGWGEGTWGGDGRFALCVKKKQKQSVTYPSPALTGGSGGVQGMDGPYQKKE